MATIQVRTDDTLKRQAQETLREIGLDLSSAINVYLRQIVITGSIPFQIRTVNGFTPEKEHEMIRDTEEALKEGKVLDGPTEEVLNEILNESDEV